MKDETELIALIADLDVYAEWALAESNTLGAFHASQFRSGLAYALGMPQTCHEPRCHNDHDAQQATLIGNYRRIAGLIRKKQGATTN